MLATHRFDELMPRAASNPAPTVWPLPPCALDGPLDREELGKFPAFQLMRLARDWVEGWDETGAGRWEVDLPARLYEPIDITLCAAHTVIAHLCTTPEHAGLPDSTLLALAGRSYWGPAPWTALVSPLETELSDERPQGWSRMAPWWRAAAMLRDHDVDLAAFALHHLWMRRSDLDLAQLTEVSDADAFGGHPGRLVRPTVESPPLHLRTILTEVLGADEAAWPAFQRALLSEFDLHSTLDEAYFEASNGFAWNDVTGGANGDPLPE